MKALKQAMKGRGRNILQAKELIVQRLSSDVQGSAQKYKRIGAREFVSFKYSEVTDANIKDACIQIEHW